MIIRSISSAVCLVFILPTIIIWVSSIAGLFTFGIDPNALDRASDCPSRSATNGRAGMPTGADSLFRKDVQRRTDPPPKESEFDRIIVINLARRQDRRDHMNLLAQAHDVKLDFFNATSFSDPEIVWIQERLWEEQNDVMWNGTALGSEGRPNSWRDFYRQRLNNWSANLSKGEERAEGEAVVMATGQEESQQQGFNSAFESIYPSSLIQGLEFSAVNSGVTSLPGPLACWVSHLMVLQSIVDRDLDRTLILEDDVDLEWDFHRSWLSIIRSLPKDSANGDDDWEMIYLGYSFSDETVNRPVFHPSVRPADHPLGTFGYALTRTGAKRILKFLQEDSRLFTKPIDWAFADYIPQSRQDGRANGSGGVFSLLPPLVGHGRHEFGTDIGGASNAWKTWLADSTMDRLEAYQRLTQMNHHESTF